MAISNRRVVTGLDEHGRSKVLFDGPVQAGQPNSAGSAAIVWRAGRVPASNEGGVDAAQVAFDIDRLNDGGANFILLELKPGTHPTMHATNSLDYLIVLRGRVMLKLETQEVVLGPGDVIVDRGILHGWTALGDEPALLAAITIPAEPVGEGPRVEP